MNIERGQYIQGLEHISKVTVSEKIKSTLEMKFLDAMTQMEDPNEYIKKTAKLIKEDNAYPIFFANHTQHANIAGLIKVYKSLWDARPKNLLVEVAYNLVNEGQSEDVVDIGRVSSTILEKEGIKYVPILRPQDIQELAKKGKEKREIAKNVHKNNMNFIKKSMEGNYALALFPETTTQGGVKNENGERVGIIDVKHGQFNNLIEYAYEIGRKLVFIPLGMVDFNRILEPRTRDYDKKKVIKWGVRETIADYFGVYLGEKIAKVMVGRPITMEDMFKWSLAKIENGKLILSSPQAVNFRFMNEVAVTLPEELQGVHKGKLIFSGQGGS